MNIICTVTNDLSFDQRMQRICTALQDGGHEVTLVGRKRKNSPTLNKQKYHQHRLKNWFDKKFWFYAEHNIRLFFYLLKTRPDVISSIDLDTILAGYCASRLLNIPLVYDAHEYFTELEEIVERPKVHKVWKAIANSILPSVKYGYTVSKGYAQLFKKNYGIDLKIVRNATVYQQKEVMLRAERSYILYQGAVNHGRGLEQLIKAMPNINCKLIICGDGDILEQLKKQVSDKNLSEKVIFKGHVNPIELKAYTAKALIGITLFENKGLSNQYSLANRFFDYMHSGVPQLAMAYPEYEQFNHEYEIAALISSLTVDEISKSLNRIIQDEKYWNTLHRNALIASKKHNWQNEIASLLETYREVEADLSNK